MESAIQEALNFPREPINVKTLAGLTELRLDNRGITDLRGLENAHSLQTLSLNNNTITDLTPLSELPLKSLSAMNNAIATLPPSLMVEVLRLDGNEVSDGRTLSVGGPEFSIGKVVTNVGCKPGRDGAVRAHYDHALVLEWATELGTHHRLETSTDLKKWEVVEGNEDIVGDGLRYRLMQTFEKRGSRYFRRITASPK